VSDSNKQTVQRNDELTLKTCIVYLFNFRIFIFVAVVVHYYCTSQANGVGSDSNVLHWRTREVRAGAPVTHIFAAPKYNQGTSRRTYICDISK